MKKFVGLVDVGVVVVVFIAIILPPREMNAAPVLKSDGDPMEFSLALAEARTIAAPGNGSARADFVRKLDDAHLNDWAIEDAVRGADADKESPTRWRALLAASIAYADRLDAIKALDFAKRALVACDSARSASAVDACPDWEQIRLQLYHDHLDAGVKKGIDPRRDLNAFRRAGEKAVLPVRITGHDQILQPQGSGSAQ